jgi:ATP-dependent helicase/DNAse subunit B
VPITLITGPANAGKARAVIDAVAAHAARDRQPLLVVPTGADADRYRAELAERQTLIGVEVCLFSGLLHRMAQRASASDPTLGPAPLGEGARRQMLAGLLARMNADAPGSPQRLALALAAPIAELSAAAATPERVRGALDTGPRRVRLLLEAYELYLGCLARGQVLDPERRARRAFDVLRSTPHLWGQTPVLMYGFDDLTALEMDAIETLGRVIDAPVIVSLAYERGRAAFAGRAWAYERLAPQAAEHLELSARADYYAPTSRAVLHLLERRLFEPSLPGSTPPMSSFPESMSLAGSSIPSSGVRLLESETEQEELSRLAWETRALVDAGIPPADIAIVHRAPGTIAAPLAHAFQAIGVPHAIVPAARLADTALGRGLIGLLACGSETLPGCDPASAGQLLAWLRAPGVIERAELVDRLEEQILKGGVTGAREARAIWERENWPLDAIDRVREAAGDRASALIECAWIEAMRLFSAPRRRRAALLDDADAEAARALRAVRDTLGDLRELASLDPGMLEVPSGLLAALSAAQLSSVPRHVGERVALLDPLALRARRVRALLLCGLQEGVFPALASPDPILSLPMRAQLAHRCGIGLLASHDALAAERYLFYATVSRPEQMLLVSWHLQDENGTPTPPSHFVDEIEQLFEHRLRREPAFDSAPRVRATTGASGPAGRNAQSSGTSDANGSRTQTSSIAAAGLGQLLDERVLASLRERRVWSASSLESFAACPVSWFIERLLRAEDLAPEPEPRARGALAHAVLSDVLLRLADETGSARITPASHARARELLADALARLGERMPIAVAPEREAPLARRLEADLERYLDHAARHQSPLEPTHIELSFGLSEEPGVLPALELDEDVLLCGRIDRVDCGAGGDAVVYDYKSGRTSSDYSGTKWAQHGRFQVALYMRAVERLVGLRPVGGFYQPLGGPDLRPRGALALDADLELPYVRTDGCDRASLNELVQEATSAAAKVAAEARSGLIEARPQTCSRTGGCRYPSICRAAEREIERCCS